MADQHPHGAGDTPGSTPAPARDRSGDGAARARGATVDTARGGTPAQARELRARGRRSIRRLLDAGRVVIDRRGYHASRVEDIVKEAQISHGTFYLYFASKDELFHSLAREVADELAGVAASLGDVTADDAGRAALRLWLGEFADAYWRNGSIVKAWTEIEVGDSDLGRLGTDVVAAFSSTLADRVRGRVASDIDADIAALALMAMTERALYYSYAQQTDIELTRLLETMVEVIHDGLFCPTPDTVEVGAS
jgi:AcrR family transcriptional regulator